MGDFDWLDIDARLLRLLVAVVDAGSITGAAQALGVTQSAVSHQLDKLRAITQDALFVKSRGIVATARAGAGPAGAPTAEPAAGLCAAPLLQPRALARLHHHCRRDFQREVLLPTLARTLREHASELSLHVIPSDVPSLEMLRGSTCDLALSPRLPDGSDIVQKRLFADSYSVYYDAQVRAAPTHLTDYLAADHATVVYAPHRVLSIDRWLQAQGLQRRFAVMVPGFAALPTFVRGSALLVTAPSQLRHGLLSGLATCAVPVPTPTVPMYMIWHHSRQDDPPHRWLRQCLEAAAQALRQ